MGSYSFRFCQQTSVVSPCAEHSRSGALADTTPVLAEFAALWNEMRERYQEFQKVEQEKKCPHLFLKQNVFLGLGGWEEKGT